jgi:hypothetical protein
LLSVTTQSLLNLICATEEEPPNNRIIKKMMEKKNTIRIMKAKRELVRTMRKELLSMSTIMLVSSEVSLYSKLYLLVII